MPYTIDHSISYHILHVLYHIRRDHGRLCPSLTPFVLGLRSSPAGCRRCLTSLSRSRARPWTGRPRPKDSERCVGDRPPAWEVTHCTLDGRVLCYPKASVFTCVRHLVAPVFVVIGQNKMCTYIYGILPIVKYCKVQCSIAWYSTACSIVS